jgi:predicted ester cyclase
VVVRWTNPGTHVGEFAGIPPTGRAFSIAGIDIYRVVDGRLSEHWHVVDQLAMLGQLGLLPESSPA